MRAVAAAAVKGGPGGCEHDGGLIPAGQLSDFTQRSQWHRCSTVLRELLANKNQGFPTNPRLPREMPIGGAGGTLSSLVPPVIATSHTRQSPNGTEPRGQCSMASTSMPWALIKVLDKQRLDPTTSVGRGFIAFLSAIAEDERQRILKRANGGRAAARKRGAKFGRKAKLTDQHQAEALERLATHR